MTSTNHKYHVALSNTLVRDDVVLTADNSKAKAKAEAAWATFNKLVNNSSNDVLADWLRKATNK
jgi:hypothetical protein